jgi:hypothetical protein
MIAAYGMDRSMSVRERTEPYLLHRLAA